MDHSSSSENFARNIQRIKSTIKHWWIFLLLGLLFVGMGAWTLSTPLASFASLAILFAAFMFVSGISSLIFSISNRNNLDDWGWHLAGSIFDFVLGLILFTHPGLTMVVLPYLVAFYFMFKGFFTFGLASDMRRYGDNQWGWLVLSAVLSTIFAVMILFNPLIGGLTVVVFTALAFFSIAFFNFVMAFSLKKVKNVASQLKSE